MTGPHAEVPEGRVDDPEPRAFYEAEVVNARWWTRELERQKSIGSSGTGASGSPHPVAQF